jgi:hypothetical protein
MKPEIWKDIKGYEGLYKISNHGRVKSLPKNHRYGSKSERILKLGKTKKQQNGLDYPTVCLSKDAIVVDYKIHRLVAVAFIPNPENKYSVNHINGIKNDNSVENLEWATASEQNYHMWKTGLITISDKWIEAMKSNIGRKHSVESKLKISKANKGHIAWNKGMTKQQEYEYRMDKKNTNRNLVGISN